MLSTGGQVIVFTSPSKDGDTLIILFGGGTKRGQQKDIDKAKALHHEYKLRKKTKTAASKTEKIKR